MNLHFTARQMDLTPEVREYADRRLAGMGSLLARVGEIDILLSAEKSRLKVEIHVQGKQGRIVVAEEGYDLPVLLNQAFDGLERKLRKEREKSREKRRRGSRDRRPGPEGGGSSDSVPRVIRADHFAVKPMSVEEAVGEFLLLKKEVLMFRTGAEDSWAVLFRRKDGSLGLVRPE